MNTLLCRWGVIAKWVGGDEDLGVSMEGDGGASMGGDLNIGDWMKGRGTLIGSDHD
jgi:hypothetical protein